MLIDILHGGTVHMGMKQTNEMLRGYVTVFAKLAHGDLLAVILGDIYDRFFKRKGVYHVGGECTAVVIGNRYLTQNREKLKHTRRVI